MAFTLPELPYAYNALEPYIDEETMKLHHDKHHNAYVTNLNKALEGTADADKSLEEIVAAAGTYPKPVRNNAGGHWNHSFFWNILGANGGQPTGALAEAITATFGSLDALKEKLNAAAAGQFGSGWGWLIVNKEGKLEVTATPNQDNPLMDVAEVKGTPILGIDVWEHAYYLKYQNKRPDYLAAIWSVFNWDVIGKNYEAAVK